MAAGKEEEKMSWLRQILEWQKDTDDSREFLNMVKGDLDLFSDSVYCFTPSGDVKTLPSGSTPIDFAYSIHSAVGNKMVGARVNGKLVPIEYVIQNGDQIEIITSQNCKGPSRDWLKLVRSTQAKTKINQWFKTQMKEDNIVRGREAVEHYCRAKGINWAELGKPEFMEKVMNRYAFKDWDSVLASIGHGGLKEGQVVNKMVEEREKKRKREITDADVLGGIADTDGRAGEATVRKNSTNCIPTSIARNASSSVIAGSSRKSLVPCIILQSRTPGIFSALLIPISTGMTSTPACAAIFPTELCCFPIKEVTIAVTSCPD